MTPTTPVAVYHPSTRPRFERAILLSRERMLTCLAATLVSVYGCSSDVSNPAGLAPEPSAARVESVADLVVTASSPSSITVGWTAVELGASYRLKYATPSIDWRTASRGCDLTTPTAPVGSPLSCTVASLSPETTYELQLMTYRTSGGVWTSSAYSNVASGTTTALRAAAVNDLSTSAVTESTVTLRWTEVDDGTGEPASYRVKYGVPPFGWSGATIGCDRTLVGNRIGAEMSCTIDALDPSTRYDVQVASFRVVNGVWQGTSFSNVAQARTADSRGLWIGRAELAALPMTGSAWLSLFDEANRSCGTVDLTDQDQSNNVCVMAKALVFARTGISSYRTAVTDALGQITTAPSYNGRALALGRELPAYVIAADLIDLARFDPALDAAFRRTIRTLLTTFTINGPVSLADCHERRPNNWGTHCGGARAAVAAYLDDTAELARAAQVFKGWLGDRSSYADFSYGDLSWQCDFARPVGINPVGCRRNGNDIDGVIPDDQRRSGSYAWPPAKENYAWEAMQGALVQAVILQRAGYPAFEWEDQALRRAAQWLYTQAGYPAEGDDTWLPYLLNHYYGTSFAAPVPSRPGKNAGWTDWTHAN